MEDVDDDFGVLYVGDVELRESESTGGLLDRSDSRIPPVGEEKSSGNGIGSRNACGGIGSELDSGHELRQFEVSDIREDGDRRHEDEEEDSGSDSEDDLNIVVNDGDCRAFAGLSMQTARTGGGLGDDAGGDVHVVTAQNGLGMKKRWTDRLMNGGRDCNSPPIEREIRFKQLKFRGPCGSRYARASYLRANPSGGIMALLTSATGDFEENEDQDYKEVSCMVHACAPPKLAVPQKGHSFSLPWYRNILDVNIDALKEKPWRCPGVDITDYFNFGLDEESWKRYCSSLEQVRQQRSLQSRVPTYGSSSLDQVYEQELVQEGMADGVGSGRTYPPSTTASLDRESLLTMQKGKAIKVAESLGERQPSVVLRPPRSFDADVVIEIALPDSPKDYSMSSKNGLNFMQNTFSKALESGEPPTDDSRNTFLSHRAEKDDALMSNTVHEGLPVDRLEENARRFDESVKGTRCFELTNASSLDDASTSGDWKISDGDGCDSQKACIQDTEGNALAEETVYKATQGVCGTSFIADSCMFQDEPSLGDRIQLSLSSLCFESESEASEDSISVDRGIKDDVYRRSPSLGSCNDFHDSSTCDQASVKTKPTNGTYTQRCRIHFQVGNVGEPDSFIDSGDVAPNLSDSRGINNWDDLVVDHSGWNRRQVAIDHSHEEHVPCSREKVYGGERFDDNPIYTSYKLSRRGQQNELDQHFRSQGKGEDFFRGRFRENGKDLERDGNHKVKCKCMEERNSFLHRELSQLVSTYSTDTPKGNDTRSRLKSEDLQSKKRTNDNGHFLGGRMEEFMLESHRASFSSTEWEGGCLENNSGRRLLYRREVKNFERRGGHRGNPLYGSDWHMELEDECQEYRDHESLSSQLYGESYASEKRWNDTRSPRDEPDQSRLFGLYKRFQRQSHCDDGGESRWPHVYNKNDGADDGVTFSGDHVCRGRKKYGSQKSLPRNNDDKFLLKHQDNQLHAEEASFFCGKSVNRGVNPKYKDADCEMVDNGIKEERNWYTRSSRGNSALFLNKGFPVSHKTKHDQTMLISGNPVNWFVRKGKSSRRYNTQRNLRPNVSSENMDLRGAGTDPTMRYRHVSQRREAAESDLPNSVSHQADKKLADKLPISAEIEDLDIEEGQIGMEEPSSDTTWEENHVPGNIAVICNVTNKKQGPKKSPEMDKVIGRIDETRIRQTLAKMEKRRERFKEPLTCKKEVEGKTNHLVNLMLEVSATKGERPARKRRWGGS
ncbi:uncharacterized protein LOC115739078 isoform X2 [Rhodamnia argentea]|uniref:Uncharacterized protein LOC115739078 isoform X2 n=1 Tax=Rhodamnia argentea TaxID=178133 RepID=A0ABM3GS43_9MYRT|nr:uncharacterized protein LOC115739078 isoform X2 [Rhodamnia argentea]